MSAVPGAEAIVEEAIRLTDVAFADLAAFAEQDYDELQRALALVGERRPADAEQNSNEAWRHRVAIILVQCTRNDAKPHGPWRADP